MAEVSGKRTLRPFPALDPEPPRRLTWRRARWPAVTCVVAGAVAAALLTWPSSSSASRPVQARFADRDGLLVLEQQSSGLLGTAAPDGSHPVMLTRVGALQGNDLPVASSDRRYLVNLEGQLVTMGPAGPTSISDLPGSLAGSAQAAIGDSWANVSFADGSRYLVATECSSAAAGPLWVADLIATAGGKEHVIGAATASAGDPDSAGALVPVPVSPPAPSPSLDCGLPGSVPDKAIELLRPGKPPRTIVTAAELTGALGLAPGTPVMLAANPSPDGSRLALSVAANVPARQEIVVITRAAQIVAHMRYPADTNDVQWSPDGRQIAFCRAERNAASSVTVWAVGQAARTIVLPGHYDLECNQLLWSPDGRQLIYQGWVKEGGLTQADDLQHGWTVIDLRSGRVHNVTAPGQPAAWLPASAGETR